MIGRLDPSAIPTWFNAVLRELSHDLPIHAAVYGVGHWRFDRDPLVIGRPEALDQCRIVAIAARHDRVIAASERGSRDPSSDDELCRASAASLPSEDRPTRSIAPGRWNLMRVHWPVRRATP
jgi:hypothetical protein